LLVQVGIYTRLSVAKDSREATSEAIDRQLDRCRALADAKVWQVLEHYSDVDVGAYRAPGRKRPPERAEFERMLADVEAGRIGGIVFSSSTGWCATTATSTTATSSVSWPSARPTAPS
jgi:DNA invertase Pin-like site-specific DNA recombinase